MFKNWYEFPAMMGISQSPYQYSITTFDGFMAEFYRNIGRDVYISVHDTTNRQANIFNKIFFDLDNIDLNRSWADTQKFVNHLQNEGVEPRVTFSANKGFHVYVDFDKPVQITDYGYRMDHYIETTAKQLGITSFDKGVCRDKNRIARVPFTTNTKSDRQCIPIDVSEFNLENPTPTIVYKNTSLFAESYLNLDVPVPDYNPDNIPMSNSNIEKELMYILANADKITDGRMNLMWRIIIPAMVYLQYNDRDILSTCESFIMSSYGRYTTKQKDFVRYYLKRNRKETYLPMRLDRFRVEHGLGGI